MARLEVGILDRTRQGAIAAARSFDSIRNAAREAAGGIDRTDTAMDKAGKSARRLGTLLAGGLGLASITLLFRRATKEATDFSTALAEVSTLLDDTGPMVEMSREIKRLSLAYGQFPTQQARATYQIISAGAAAGAEAMQLLEAANRLAIGGVTDVTTAADGLTTILNAWGDAAGTATEVSDALFVAMRAGKTTIGELSQSISFVAASAAQLGISLDEVLAATSAITKGGVPTQRAMRGLAQVFAGINKPSSEAAKMATELQIEFNAAALSAQGFAGFLQTLADATGRSSDKLAQFFGGVEALLPVLQLTGTGAKDFSEILIQMGQRAGATQIAFEKMSRETSVRFDRLRASTTVTLIEIGEQLLPVLEDISDEFSSLAQQDEFINTMRNMTRALADLLTGLKNIVTFVARNRTQLQLAAMLTGGAIGFAQGGRFGPIGAVLGVGGGSYLGGELTGVYGRGGGYAGGGGTSTGEPLYNQPIPLHQRGPMGSFLFPEQVVSAPRHTGRLFSGLSTSSVAGGGGRYFGFDAGAARGPGLAAQSFDYSRGVEASAQRLQSRLTALSRTLDDTATPTEKLRVEMDSTRAVAEVLADAEAAQEQERQRTVRAVSQLAGAFIGLDPELDRVLRSVQAMSNAIISGDPFTIAVTGFRSLLDMFGFLRTDFDRLSSVLREVAESSRSAERSSRSFVGSLADMTRIEVSQAFLDTDAIRSLVDLFGNMGDVALLFRAVEGKQPADSLLRGLLSQAQDYLGVGPGQTLQYLAEIQAGLPGFNLGTTRGVQAAAGLSPTIANYPFGGRNLGTFEGALGAFQFGLRQETAGASGAAEYEGGFRRAFKAAFGQIITDVDFAADTFQPLIELTSREYIEIEETLADRRLEAINRGAARLTEGAMSIEERAMNLRFRAEEIQAQSGFGRQVQRAGGDVFLQRQSYLAYLQQIESIRTSQRRALARLRGGGATGGITTAGTADTTNVGPSVSTSAAKLGAGDLVQTPTAEEIEADLQIPVAAAINNILVDEMGLIRPLQLTPADLVQLRQSSVWQHIMDAHAYQLLNGSIAPSISATLRTEHDKVTPAIFMPPDLVEVPDVDVITEHLSAIKFPGSIENPLNTKLGEEREAVSGLRFTAAQLLQLPSQEVMLTHLGGDDGIAGVISGTIDTVLAAEAPKIVALHLSPYRLLSLPTETQMLEHLMESDVLNGLISGPMDIVLAQEGSQIYSLDLSPSRLLTLPTMQQMTEHLMQPTALNGLISGPMDVVLFQEGPKIKELTLAPESLVSVPTEETFDTFLRTELDDFLSTDLNTLGIAPRLGVLDLRLSDFVRVDRGNLADLLQTELQLALDDVSASPVLHRLIEWDTTGFAENLADVIVDMDEDRLVGNEISAGGGIGGLTTSRGFITRR